jgi:sensitive to high expression protein 9
MFVRASRLAVRKAKDDYSNAISQRSASQREVNELLQRKHAWSAADLERFTSLYRSDHANEQAETAAQNALVEAERIADEAAARLSKSILARYHEEQIWSDKIRRMSTWGTWGLMGVNVLLFLVFQIGVEPWRRKRLVKGFEEKVKEALGNQDTGAAAATEIGLGLESAAATERFGEPSAAASPTETPTGSPEPSAMGEGLILEASSPQPPDLPYGSPLYRLSAFEACKASFQDLFSERQVSVRKLDVTVVALEGAVTGAALVGFIVALLRWR